MTKGAKIGIIVGVVIILGVGGYFAYKKFFGSDGTDTNDDSVDDQKPEDASQIQNVSSETEFPATPFKNKGQGDYFRLWVNRYYSKDAKALDLDKQGDYNNKFIRKAWMKYGVLYKQQVNNWDKIKNPIPASFVEKFEKKDSYNFSINSTGQISLIPKISGKKISFIDDVWFIEGIKTNQGFWWDGGKQANVILDGGKKKNFKASNFFELAKILQKQVGKDNFSSFTYRNNLDLENNFVD